MRTNRSFLRRMVIASCFACVVIAPVNVEAGVQSDNGRATESELREQGTNERILSADNSADMQQGDIVKYPRWNVGTNLLEWIGVMPDLKYTTWASNVHGEFYFKKQYSVLLSAAYSEHHYSHGDKFQGFTSYIVEPRLQRHRSRTQIHGSLLGSRSVGRISLSRVERSCRRIQYPCGISLDRGQEICL